MSYVPQVGSNRRPFAMWLFVAMGSLLVILLTVGAPTLLAAGHKSVALTIYQTFSHLCHQIPERSFFLDGHPLAVCSRCTGLYTGFLGGIVSYPLIRSFRRTDAPSRKWLFAAAAPLAIDFGLEFFGIWHNTHFSRFATGVLLGGVSAFYVMPGLLDLSLRDWRAKRNVSTVSDANQVSRSEPLSTNVSAAPSDYSAPHRRI
jgi:uncharacterized membrane protein